MANPEQTTAAETDTKLEKSKKTKRFLKFFSRFINHDEKSSETTELDTEKVNLLDVLKDFSLKKSEEDDDYDKDQDVDIDVVEDDIEVELDRTTTSLVEDTLSEDEYERNYVNYLVLKDVDEHIKDKDEIEVDKIIQRVELEIDQRASKKDKKHEAYDQEERNIAPAPVEKIKKFVMEVTNREPAINRGNSLKEAQIEEKEHEPTTPIIPEDSLVEKPVVNPEYIEPDRVGRAEHVPHVSQESPRIPQPERLIPRSQHFEPSRILAKQFEAISVSEQIPHRAEIKFNKRPVVMAEAVDLRKAGKSELPNHVTSSTEKHTPTEKHIEQREDIHMEPSYGQLLQEAGKILIDGVSLRRIFESSNLKQEDLRDLLEARHDKKKFKKLLAKSLRRRRDSYEAVRGKIRGENFQELSAHGSNSLPIAGSHSTHVSMPVTAQESHASQQNSRANKTPATKRLNHPLITILVIALLMIVALLLSKHLF